MKKTIILFILNHLLQKKTNDIKWLIGLMSINIFKIIAFCYVLFTNVAVVFNIYLYLYSMITSKTSI